MGEAKIKKSIFWHVFFFFTKQRRARIRKCFRTFVPIVLIAFLFDSLIYEPYFALHSEYTEIPSKNWTSELSNMKIALVSDLHLGSNWLEKWRFQQIIDEVNSQKPDIILLLGDYVNRQRYYSSMEVSEIADGLAKMNAPLGIYAVSGNHDEFWALDSIRRNFKRVGIKFLENESVKVSSKFGDFYIAGVRDISEGDFDFFAALEKVPSGAPCLLLSHEPDIFPALPLQASVTFAGHSHGGLIRLPIIGAILRPKIMPFMIDNMGLFLNHWESPIFITRGLGTTRIPIRFYCTPVVDIVKIVPSK